MSRRPAIRSAERHTPIRTAQRPFLDWYFDVSSNIQNIVPTPLLGTEVSTPLPSTSSFHDEYQILVRSKPTILSDPESSTRRNVCSTRKIGAIKSGSTCVNTSAMKCAKWLGGSCITRNSLPTKRRRASYSTQHYLEFCRKKAGYSATRTQQNEVKFSMAVWQCFGLIQRTI